MPETNNVVRTNADLRADILSQETLLTEKTYSILLIEDNPGDALLVKELLKSSGIGFSLSLAVSLKDTLSLFPGNEFDVILLDLGLPDSVGLETVRRIQDFDNNSPIVVMTGLDDRDTALAALREGAQDYLVKNNLTSDVILHAIIYSIERKKIQRLLKKKARQFSLLSSATAAINECKDIPAIFTESCNDIRILLDNVGVIGIESNNHKRSHTSGFEYFKPWLDPTKPITDVEFREKFLSANPVKNEMRNLFNEGKLQRMSDDIQTYLFRDDGNPEIQPHLNGPDLNVYAVGIVKNGRSYGGILIFTSDPVQGDDADIVEAICYQASLCALRKTIETELRLSESRYRNLNKELENKVRMRTLDLESSNYRLNQELIERHKIEESLKKSESSLKEINNAKDKFFNIIAHDLKNPFTSLLGATELLNNNIDRMSPEKIKELAVILNDSAKGGFEVLQNLLAWSRSQTGLLKFNPERVNLHSLIATNMSDLRMAAERKNIRMVDNVKDEIIIFADKNMLNTVLRNLLGNAIKFTYNSGNVEVSAVEHGNGADISVKDTGIGISDDQVNDLFRRDSISTKPGTNMEQGTGLGLKICKEFVEIHGGKIWVNSILNQGSEFVFSIPG